MNFRNILIFLPSLVYNLPTSFLSEPSSEDRIAARHEHPSALSPWISLLLDATDAVLKTLHSGARGERIKVSQFLTDLHQIQSSPYGLTAIDKAMLPFYMNNCEGKSSDACKRITGLEFIRPCYKEGASLEAILADYKRSIEFIDFKSLHTIHPLRLSKVQLPIQLLLLRFLEGAAALTADDYRNVLGRFLCSVSGGTDILGYILQTTIADDVGSRKKFSIDGAVAKEFSSAFEHLVASYNPARLLRLVSKHGILGLLQSTPELTGTLRSMLRNYGIFLTKLETPATTYTLTHVSPHKFVASLVSRLTTFFKEAAGLNIRLDLSQVEFDVSLELFIGMGLDISKLLYACLQGLIERDSEQWIGKHSNSQFTDYINHIKRSDRRMSYGTDDVFETITVFLKDTRQRSLLNQLFRTCAFGANTMNYGIEVIEKEKIELISSVILDHGKLPLLVEEPLASALINAIEDPTQIMSLALKIAQGQSTGFSFSSFVKDQAIPMVLSRIDFYSITTRLFGFRVSEYNVIFKYLRVIVGDHIGEHWNDATKQRVSLIRVPFWSLQFNARSSDRYLQRIWAALIPPTSHSDDHHTILLMQKPLDLLLNSVDTMTRSFENTPPIELSERFPDDLASLLSLPRTLASLVVTFGLQSVVAQRISLALSLPYENDISLMLSDLTKSSDDRLYESEISKFVVSFYRNLPLVSKAAASWRAHRESVMTSACAHPSKPKIMVDVYSSNRNIVRAVLFIASVVFIATSVRIMRAPRGTRSFFKALKQD